MSIYLVRHAKAGSRRSWKGPDDLRPLSEAGRHQADHLADLLADLAGRTEGESDEATSLPPIGITRVLTSPFVRCQQTVEPLAARLGLSIERTSELAEDETADAARHVLDLACASDAGTVLCTHGNIVGDLLTEALRHGARGHGIRLEESRIEKASTWLLTLDAGMITDARYLPPPT